MQDLNENDYGIFFYGDELLVHKIDEQFIFPIKDIPLDFATVDHYFLGEISGKRTHAIILPTKDLVDETHWNFLPLRRYLETAPAEIFSQISRGKQLLHWHQISKFCGSCGAETEFSTVEDAKICPQCHRIIYPTAAPAVIVLIEREREILLARSPHFTKGVYSTLAGFVSPGETAEHAIEREIFEEVGVKIKNIKYFGSQMWPFPGSFMLGYQVEYASGEIKIDPKEIEDAQWFDIDNLPPLPSRSSISRWLIEDYLKRKRSLTSSRTK